MQIKQIRNATNKIYYGGRTFLLDPWLMDQYALGCMDDTPVYRTPDPVQGKIPMPLFPLPESKEEILSGIDAYIITHLHPDHIDMNFQTGQLGEPLEHHLPVFVQGQEDAAALQASGFQDVRILSEDGTDFNGVTLYRTPTRHGTIKASCDACGVVFQAPGEKTLYVAGDTVWFQGVRQTLEQYQPEVITLNACGAELMDYGRLIMNDEDVECVHRTLPQAQLFLTHFDNVAHASLTRRQMHGCLHRRQVGNYIIPADGETILL